MANVAAKGFLRRALEKKTTRKPALPAPIFASNDTHLMHPLLPSNPHFSKFKAPVGFRLGQKVTHPRLFLKPARRANRNQRTRL
jgi:hypothetical protein